MNVSEKRNKQVKTHIEAITIEQNLVRFKSDIVTQEINSAKIDLLQENSFTLLSGLSGPYFVHLSTQHNRIMINVTSTQTEEREEIWIPCSPFRQLIKDYFLICENYYDVVQNNVAKIQAVDMGRRALHNEAADKLITVLSSHIEMNHDTARRLFTFIASLHIKQMQS